MTIIFLHTKQKHFRFNRKILFNFYKMFFYFFKTVNHFFFEFELHIFTLTDLHQTIAQTPMGLHQATIGSLSGLRQTIDGPPGQDHPRLLLSHQRAIVGSPLSYRQTGIEPPPSHTWTTTGPTQTTIRPLPDHHIASTKLPLDHHRITTVRKLPNLY